MRTKHLLGHRIQLLWCFFYIFEGKQAETNIRNGGWRSEKGRKSPFADALIPAVTATRFRTVAVRCEVKCAITAGHSACSDQRVPKKSVKIDQVMRDWIYLEGRRPREIRTLFLIVDCFFCRRLSRRAMSKIEKGINNACRNYKPEEPGLIAE